MFLCLWFPSSITMLMAKLNPLLLSISLHLLAIIVVGRLCETTYSKSRGLQLKMFHIDSPGSPMYQPELTHSERTRRLIDISESRIRYLVESTTQKNGSWYSELVKASMVRIQGCMYYVEIGLGEFTFDPGYHRVFLILDTGSDVTWTQCEGCTKCFAQTSPFYPKSSSTTYQRYACNDCPGGQCYQDHCSYHASYGDGTSVTGIWATEKLTFLSDPFPPESKYGFTFVCAMEIQNFAAVAPAGNGNIITGILGLGRGDFSLMSQLEQEGINVFSYCIQRIDQQAFSGPAILRFGDAVIRLDLMQDTPFFKGSNPAYYHLSLDGISVNGKRLKIPREIFGIKPNGNGGTIIDSGATLTYLNSRAYNFILKKITDYMQENNPSMGRYADSFTKTGFYACWEPAYESPSVDIPTLAFHLQNDVNFFIQPPEVMVKYKVEDVPYPGYIYCLTMAPSPSDLNMIGTYHQTNQLIIYDLEYSTLSFANYDCSQTH